MQSAAFLLLVALLLNGCAASAPPPTGTAKPIVSAAEAGEHAWHRACFRLQDNGQDAPDWSLDVLLAGEVAAPILHQHRAGIELWRFHRRAARDASGHQFSLWLYTDATTATTLFHDLRSHPLVRQLTDKGQLRELRAPCDGATDLAGAGASSDPAWDPRLGKTWPYFIMGVSQHWLALIEAVEAELPQRDRNANELPGLLERYRRISREIDDLWREQGQHAYLHHLNALFGYQPLLIRH
jgi:hypothetical protein